MSFFLNIKSKVNLPQALVILADFGYPVYLAQRPLY
jgi:hypothetical protein